MFEEHLDFGRRRPETVAHLARQPVERLRVRDGGALLVEPHPAAHIAQIAFRHAKLEAEVHDAAGPRRLAPGLGDRFLEEPVVEVEPYRLQMAVLGRAEEVARAAELHVERRHPEPGAQLAELPQGRQPRLGGVRERGALRTSR